LELKEDGTALERGIGPTDVPEETEGRWTVDPDGSNDAAPRGILGARVGTLKR
jgi:hypothetical protein